MHQAVRSCQLWVCCLLYIWQSDTINCGSVVYGICPPNNKATRLARCYILSLLFACLLTCVCWGGIHLFFDDFIQHIFLSYPFLPPSTSSSYYPLLTHTTSCSFSLKKKIKMTLKTIKSDLYWPTTPEHVAYPVVGLIDLVSLH